MTSPRYAIVLDDHPLVLQGMMQLLRSAHLDLDILAASTWDQMQSHISSSRLPQILVTDVWLAEENSLQSLKSWIDLYPGVPCLAISGDDDPAILQRVRDAGAQGFVHKQEPPEIFVQAFDLVLSGGEWFPFASGAGKGSGPREWTVSPDDLGLTVRQGEILSLVLRGLPNKRIALMLGLSESTVKEHLTGILGRMGVRTRVEILTHLRGRKLVLK
jgi:DNA-binding NarL/FixJ family response regulator